MKWVEVRRGGEGMRWRWECRGEEREDMDEKKMGLKRGRGDEVEEMDDHIGVEEGQR